MGRAKEIFKLMADRMKERTLSELLENDVEYQKKLEEERKALKEYQKLELNEEQRVVVETLIARKDETDFEHTINAYIAGILDGYEILQEFDLTKE